MDSLKRWEYCSCPSVEVTTVPTETIGEGTTEILTSHMFTMTTTHDYESSFEDECATVEIYKIPTNKRKYSIYDSTGSCQVFYTSISYHVTFIQTNCRRKSGGRVQQTSVSNVFTFW